MIVLLVVLAMVGHWVETTQEDFADGTFESNIYASLRDGGAIEFTSRWDFNSDGYLDILVANERWVDSSYLYWGSDTGYYPTNRTDYPIHNAGDCEVSDLDYDSYPELIFACGNFLRLRIFNGTPNGPDPTDYIDIPIIYYMNESCYIADFNKDGYLDIAVGEYDDTNGGIFWGDSTGYSSSNMTLLPARGKHNIEAADFDKNGWLDIVFVQQKYNVTLVYWGDSSGYSPANKTEIDNPGSENHGCSIADLNYDNYLDIVLTCFGNDQLYIYTGSESGFVLWQSLMPGPCYGGTSIADFNDDGYLDILYTPGYAPLQKPGIYWGSSSGYSEVSKTEIGILMEASGSLVADFNFDGYLDIFVNQYRDYSQSYLFNGPDFTTYTALPNYKDHHGIFREIGNIYNRKYYENYKSSIYNAGEIVIWQTLSWIDSLPPGTEIQCGVRTGNTPTPDSTWSNWWRIPNGGKIPDSLQSRYIQYMTYLGYTNPCYFPVLWEVNIEYGMPEIVENTFKHRKLDLKIKPTPFVSNTLFTIAIPQTGRVSLKIYNKLGEIVRAFYENEQCQPGVYSIKWDGKDDNSTDCASGVYFCLLEYEYQGKTEVIRSSIIKGGRR